jgi:hypothetical protein
MEGIRAVELAVDLVGHGDELAGEPDPGRSCADDGERGPGVASDRIGLFGGHLVGVEDPAAQRQGLVEGLHGKEMARPFVVAEVGRLCPGGDDEVVEADVSAFSADPDEGDGRPVEVDAVDVTQHDLGVVLAGHDGTDRRGDLAGGEDGRRHLVEERLEQVVVVTVDDHHLGSSEPAGGCETSEAGTDDDDPRPAHRRPLVSPVAPTASVSAARSCSNPAVTSTPRWTRRARRPRAASTSRSLLASASFATPKL